MLIDAKWLVTGFNLDWNLWGICWMLLTLWTWVARWSKLKTRVSVRETLQYQMQSSFWFVLNRRIYFCKEVTFKTVPCRHLCGFFAAQWNWKSRTMFSSHIFTPILCSYLACTNLLPFKHLSTVSLGHTFGSLGSLQSLPSPKLHRRDAFIISPLGLGPTA